MIVGTPGHLRELLVLPVSHLARGVKSVEFLILDEADRLLDMGFKEWCLCTAVPSTVMLPSLFHYVL